ncbi:MAG: hypothetical protein Q7U04_13385 [Bacteriovorax sp.]|nr:hypothetical protein [Bacteriovorax sp.]
METFIHDLRNDLQIIKLLLRKISDQNETVDKINNVIETIASKCQNILDPESSKDVLINVNQAIVEIINRYPDLNFEKDFEDHIDLVGNKNKFEEVIANIIDNSKEAGASTIKFETKYKSLIIRDNGICEQNVVDKLNNSNIFTTKINGSGKGSQLIRAYCEKQGCRILYSKVLNGKPVDNKFSLVLRIKFP